jgi:hypothetical protein
MANPTIPVRFEWATSPWDSASPWWAGLLRWRLPSISSSAYFEVFRTATARRLGSRPDRVRRSAIHLGAAVLHVTLTVWPGNPTLAASV